MRRVGSHRRTMPSTWRPRDASSLHFASASASACLPSVEAVGSCKPPVRVGGGLFGPWRDASTARCSEGPRRRVESGTVGVIEGKRVPSGMEMPVRGDASETDCEGKQRIGVQQTVMRTRLIRQQSSRRMCIPACPPCYPTLKIAPQALPNTIPAGGEFRGPEGPFPNFERTLHRDRRSRPQRLSAPHPTLHQRIGNTDKRTHAPARTSPPNGTQSPQRKCRTQDNHVAEGYLPTQPTQYASSRLWVGLPLPRVGSEPITPTVPDSRAVLRRTPHCLFPSILNHLRTVRPETRPRPGDTGTR